MIGWVRLTNVSKPSRADSHFCRSRIGDFEVLAASDSSPQVGWGGALSLSIARVKEFPPDPSPPLALLAGGGEGIGLGQQERD